MPKSVHTGLDLPLARFIVPAIAFAFVLTSVASDIAFPACDRMVSAVVAVPEVDRIQTAARVVCAGAAMVILAGYITA